MTKENIINQNWDKYIPHNSKGFPDRQCWSTSYHKIYYDGKEYLECRRCVYDTFKRQGRIGPK